MHPIVVVSPPGGFRPDFFGAQYYHLVALGDELLNRERKNVLRLAQRLQQAQHAIAAFPNAADRDARRVAGAPFEILGHKSQHSLYVTSTEGLVGLLNKSKRRLIARRPRKLHLFARRRHPHVWSRVSAAQRPPMNDLVSGVNLVIDGQMDVGEAGA